MNETRKRKSKQLGMHPSTAANRLRKTVLFSLIKVMGLNNCWHCGEEIENIDNLSIEHKVPWLDSEDPVGLFFDLNNIAFSHLECNIRNNRWAKGGVGSRKPLTEEHKQNISKALKGRIVPVEILRKLHETNGRLYPSFTGPNGTVYPAGKNLSAFCREHNLDPGNMSRLKREEHKICKGWRVT